MPNPNSNRVIFFDTNIVLDLIDDTRAEHRQVQNLLKYLVENDITIMISEDMLSTIYYIHNDKQGVLDLFEMILNEWLIVPYGKDIINAAILYSRENHADFEDALQCICAKKYDCLALLTCDKKFIQCGVDILDYHGWDSKAKQLF